MFFKVAANAVVACGMAALLVACFVDGPPRTRGSGGMAGANGTYEGGGAGPASAASEPMLVEVDTGKTMAVAPGDGVGVFVEYATGGKWHIWWTCDTHESAMACDFDVDVSVLAGSIDAPKSEGFASRDTLTVRTPQHIHATTTTTTTVPGVTFTTDPGAVIRLEAAVSGLQESGFLFFVQDGKVNGGFAGKLTNPLLLTGTTP